MRSLITPLHFLNSNKYYRAIPMRMSMEIGIVKPINALKKINKIRDLKPHIYCGFSAKGRQYHPYLCRHMGLHLGHRRPINPTAPLSFDSN